MNVFNFIPEGIQDCTVTAWLHSNNEGNELQHFLNPTIIICPGGGYGHVSKREAEPIAAPYYAAGYNVFILTYSVGEEAKGFKPLLQLASTISHIRKHAQEWFIDKDKIAVCGFSAGGHLAGSLGTLYNEEKFQGVFNRNDDIRPNAMILIYPVITADEYAHQGSIENVSGCAVGTAGYKWFGLDKHVDSTTPPTFLFHTAEDTCVPVENSLFFMAALSRENIEFESHILPKGAHGGSAFTKEVGTENPYNARWIGWSIEWLRKVFE